MSKGRVESPVCPRGCKTKSGKPQHMRRIFTYPYDSKRKTRLMRKVGWICPKCKFVIIE
ncbi:MAG: hypothetical protein QXT14_05240 [Candidatus Bathyarchaeia archaeon]